MIGTITHVHRFESPLFPGDVFIYGVILNDKGRKYVWTARHLAVDSERVTLGETVRFSVTRGDYASHIVRVKT